MSNDIQYFLLTISVYSTEFQSKEERTFHPLLTYQLATGLALVEAWNQELHLGLQRGVRGLPPMGHPPQLPQAHWQGAGMTGGSQAMNWCPHGQGPQQKGLRCSCIVGLDVAVWVELQFDQWRGLACCARAPPECPELALSPRGACGRP